MEITPLQVALLVLLLPFVTEGVKSSIANWGGGQLKDKAGVIAVWVIGIIIALGTTVIHFLSPEIRVWVDYFGKILAGILASQGVFVTARAFIMAAKE